MSYNNTNINMNNIIQGLIALIAVGGTFALVLTHNVVPDVVLILDGAITAYYFTYSSSVNTARAVVREQNGQYNQ